MTTPYGESPRSGGPDAATWRAEDALRDKIAAAFPRWLGTHISRYDLAAMVLPIVAAELTAAREQGVAEERARIVALLAGDTSMRWVAEEIGEAQAQLTLPQERHVAFAVLAALRDLIVSKGGAS